MAQILQRTPLYERHVALGARMVPFAGWDVYKWIEAFWSDHYHNDFTFYVAAARIGLRRGWPSIYDLSFQQAELDAMGSRIHVAELARQYDLGGPARVARRQRDRCHRAYGRLLCRQLAPATAR